MISFYPGPSRVYEQIPEYTYDAYHEGIMGINHRSKEFMNLYDDVVELLRLKLEVPDDYLVCFTSSATECWEIIAQSLIQKTSYHFFNGAFGEKWFQYTKKIKPYAIGYRYDMDLELKTGELDLSSNQGVICVTQNETSNGTMISNRRLAKLRKKYPEHLIAIDATSSMAGVNLQFNNGDVWYASVQKCFGMPAGMAVMLLSPKAVERAMEINERDYYNSLPVIIDNLNKRQTTHTPNVLNIYLLKRVLEKIKPIHNIQKKIRKRQREIVKTIEDIPELALLTENKKVLSSTVLTIKGDEDIIALFKENAAKNNILLGNGYGAYKKNTFRIANFPALKNKEIKKLHAFLQASTQLIRK